MTLAAQDVEAAYTVPIDLLQLANESPDIAEDILAAPKATLQLLDSALVTAQHKLLRNQQQRNSLTIKERVRGRLTGNCS